MEESPSVALKLANTLEDLEVVGAVLTGIADGAGLVALERSDMQTAVLEACKNVVWHAYEGVPGPLELEVAFAAGMVEVTVRDHGIGIRPHLGERTLPHTGIGMPITHLLARRITYTKVAHGGTEVRMEFSMPSVSTVEAHVAPAVLELLAAGEWEASILLALAGRPLVGAVLGPVLIALGTRAGMAPEGVAELRRLAGSLTDAARSDDEGPEELTLQARLTPAGIDLYFSPLGGRLERMLRDHAVPGGGDGALPPADDVAGEEPGERPTLRLRPAG
jgi:anti-sigma regulatory factor (Ser/Thr protein kinase)